MYARLCKEPGRNASPISQGTANGTARLHNCISSCKEGAAAPTLTSMTLQVFMWRDNRSLARRTLMRTRLRSVAM